MAILFTMVSCKKGRAECSVEGPVPYCADTWQSQQWQVRISRPINHPVIKVCTVKEGCAGTSLYWPSLYTQYYCC